MPTLIDRRSACARLAWFGALWASGVLSMGAVAGLLRLVLSGMGGSHRAPDEPADRGAAKEQGGTLWMATLS